MTTPFQEPLEVSESGTSSRFYNTALVRDKADLNFSIEHTVHYGDRFDNLAFRYYRTPTLWWYIAKANGIVDGSMTAPVGTVLKIPKL